MTQPHHKHAAAADRCGLCEREAPLTFHHFVPRKLHRNKWFRKHTTRDERQSGIDVCRDCHAAIHRFITDHKQLGRSYNTAEKLKAHPEMATFLSWIRGRRTGRVRTRQPNGA